MADLPRMPTPARTAVWLLSATLAIGLASRIFTPLPADPDLPSWFPAFIAFATGAVMVPLIAVIANGRRWAAVVLAVLFLLGLQDVPFLLRQWSDAPVKIVFATIQTLGQALAVVLLFTPRARKWFHDCMASRARGKLEAGSQ